MATDGQDRPLPCLFCAHSFEDAAARFEHMYQQHGFFVPDREYLADADGLLHRLYQVISTVNVCLTCGLSFRQGDPDSKEPVSEQARRKGISSVQMHMRDKVASSALEFYPSFNDLEPLQATVGHGGRAPGLVGLLRLLHQLRRWGSRKGRRRRVGGRGWGSFG
jgi:hypothetical protein